MNIRNVPIGLFVALIGMTVLAGCATTITRCAQTTILGVPVADECIEDTGRPGRHLGWRRHYWR